MIFVAMATRRMDSQSVLFLNHEILELLLSMMIRDIYTSLQKLLRNDPKTLKIAKLMQVFLGFVIFVAMVTRRMNSQSV